MYIERILKTRCKILYTNMLSKGVHRCDVVSLLFVSPDAKKIKYFPKGVEGPLKNIYSQFHSMQNVWYSLRTTYHDFQVKIRQIGVVVPRFLDIFIP